MGTSKLHPFWYLKTPVVIENYAVDGWVPELDEWLKTGASPYLDKADGDANYISVRNTNKYDRYYTFGNTSLSTIMSVIVYLRMRSTIQGVWVHYDVYLWDGTTYQLVGSMATPSATYITIGLDATSILDTPAKVNNARLQLRSKLMYTWGRATYAYLSVQGF